MARRPRQATAICAIVFVCAFAGFAHADVPQTGSPSYVVTTTDDHNDGVCGEVDCTLREAIQQANANSGSDTITFASTVRGTISASFLQITDSVTIIGPGARLLAISGNHQAQVFSVTGAGPTTISGLTIENGFNSSIFYEPVLGAGIYNVSTLFITNCTFTGNELRGGDAYNSSGSDGGLARGSAIYNGGSLTVIGSTFWANHVMGGHGNSVCCDPYSYVGAGGAGEGAGIYNAAGKTLSVQNCTFRGNSAGGGWGGNNNRGPGGTGGNAFGGAIANRGTMTIYCSTIVGNSAAGAPGGNWPAQNAGADGNGICGVAALAGTTTVGSTIIAQNSIVGANPIKDVSGSFHSDGYNFIGIIDGATGFGATADQIGTELSPLDPRLGIIASNGGGTDTLVPNADSPVIDKGRSFSLSKDQRGLPRVADSRFFSNAPGGDGTDIGAVEVSPFDGVVDSDGDGMPDEFETFFAVTDPNDDPDGDGYSNLVEFQNRTDPRDNSSFPMQVTSIVRTDDDVAIIFRCVGGKTFRLDGKESLSAEDWAELGDVPPVTPAANGEAQLIDQGGALRPLRFYRVRLAP